MCQSCLQDGEIITISNITKDENHYRINKCSNCGFVSTDPIPTITGEIYNLNYYNDLDAGSNSRVEREKIVIYNLDSFVSKFISKKIFWM